MATRPSACAALPTISQLTPSCPDEEWYRLIFATSVAGFVTVGEIVQGWDPAMLSIRKKALLVDQLQDRVPVDP